MEAPLNSSMETAYSVQRISCSSSTPVTRYSKRSIGRTTGSRKVRSRLNTFAMNTPSGLVIARIRARKTAICIQPLMVMSEFFRPQQGIQQVDHQPGTHQQHDDRFSIHIDLASGDLSSANSIAELHIAKRQDEKDYRHHDKDQVLHTILLHTQTNLLSRSELHQDVEVDRRLVSAQIGEPHCAALGSADCLRGAQSRDPGCISVVASKELWRSIVRIRHSVRPWRRN